MSLSLGLAHARPTFLPPLEEEPEEEEDLGEGVGVVLGAGVAGAGAGRGLQRFLREERFFFVRISA